MCRTLPISHPFVLGGQVNGKFVRVLLDTGAQASIANRATVKRLALSTHQLDHRVGIGWGAPDATAPETATALTTALRLWPKAPNAGPVELPSTTFLVADLRVDLIIGLPLIQQLASAQVNQTDTQGNPLLVTQLERGGPTFTFGGRASKSITCSAAAFHHKPPPRTKPPVDDDPGLKVLTPRAFRRALRRKHLAECNLVYLVPVADPVVVAAGSMEAEAKPPATEVPPALQGLVKEFLPTLFADPVGLPPDRGEDNFRIELEDPNATPVFQPVRHQGPDDSAELRKQLDELLAKGYIRHSTSPWGAPILFAKKKDGGMRCCIDYRRLNALTKKDRTPLPNLAELRDKMHGVRYVTSVDVRDAYHRTRVRTQDIEKTAIRTRFGHFEYLVMPFGLTNAPATFQRLMNRILGHLYDVCVVSYLDDILIYSKTEEEHVQHVRQVFELLTKHALNIKLSKCQFMQDEVEFCGHIIGAHGMRIAPSKLEVLDTWPLPRNYKDIQSFLGFTNYLCQFVNGYAEIALPLSALQSGSKDWVWETDEQNAFDKLRDAIKTAPVLKTFDPAKTTYVFTDASGFAYGGWLAQAAEDADEYPFPLPKQLTARKNLPPLRPIAFYARKMNGAETRYPTHERELLALVKTITKHRHYLLAVAVPFRCLSDHQSLIYLQTQPHLSRRQAAWVEDLQSFNFTIEYLDGPLNTIADVLSRNPEYAPRCADCQTKVDVAATVFDFHGPRNLSTDDWQLNPDLFAQLDRHFAAKHDVDLFASDLNRQLPRYVTAAQDAFKLDWSTLRGWANPPWKLIGRVLDKVLADQATLTLVAPVQPERPWFSTLLRLRCAEPVQLTHSDRLFRRYGTHFAGPPPWEATAAWRLSGDPSRQLPEDAPLTFAGPFAPRLLMAPLSATNVKPPPLIGSEAWREAVANDPDGGPLLRTVKTLDSNHTASDARPVKIRRFSVDDRGVLMYEGIPWVPASLRTAALSFYHDPLVSGGHMGVARTTAKIRRSMTWPSLDADAAKYISTCGSCQRFKSRRWQPYGLLRSIPVPPAVFHTVGFDCFAMPRTNSYGGEEHKQGYDSVFCAVDYVSSLCILEPTSQELSSAGLGLIWKRRVWSEHGSPSLIISDREPRALAEAFSKQMKDMGTEHRPSTSRHQQTDGKTERMIQALKNILKHYLDFKGTNWVDLLPIVQFQWNSSPRPETGLSPFEVARGYNPWHPTADKQADKRTLELPTLESNKVLRETLDAVGLTVQQYLRAAQDKQAEFYDKNRKPLILKAGDMVLLNREGINAPYLRAKPESLGVHWLGPFEVEGPGPDPNSYKLRLPLQHERLHPVFNVDVLKRWNQREGEPPPDPGEDIDGYLEYKVERILKEQGTGRRKKYYVKWLGYSMEHCTWETEAALQDVEALDHWEKEQEERKAAQEKVTTSARVRRKKNK